LKEPVVLLVVLLIVLCSRIKDECSFPILVLSGFLAWYSGVSIATQESDLWSLTREYLPLAW
jgi:hypothetical protein